MIEQLYDEYHGPILRHLERLVQERETAEDLCHETFIKALRNWSDLENEAAARGWLYRIATNTAYDYLRRQRRIAMTPLDDMTVVGTSTPTLESRHEDAESIWAVLNHLPDHYRIPLLLHNSAGYNLHDIAATQGCSVTTMKMRVHRARMKFRYWYSAEQKLNDNISTVLRGSHDRI